MKSISFYLKVILSFLVIISSCALIFAQTNEEKDDTLVTSNDDDLFFMSNYTRGGWIYWNELTSDTLLDTLENTINQFLNYTNSSCLISLSIIEKFQPFFLICDIYLVFQSSCHLGPLYNTFFLFDSKNFKYQDFLGEITFKPNPFWSNDPDEIYKLNRYRRQIATDSSDALAIAEDIVVFGSPVLPILLLNDIYEVYEFSNSIYDDRFWKRKELKDSIMTTLGSFRNKNIRDTELFFTTFQNPKFDSTEFNNYNMIVHPPSIKKVIVSLEDYTWVVSLFTWSPRGGKLMKWQISISHKDGFISHKYEELTENMGLTFRYP